MRTFWLILIFLFVSAGAEGQVTSNVLYRVLRIRTASGTCSGFTIEVGVKQYLVTARHCLDGVSAQAQLDVWRDSTWKPVRGRVILPAHPDVDIAALDAGESLTVRYQFEPTSDGILLGQPVYFLGYPSGLATRGQIPAPAGFGEIPFMKAGVLSAMDSRRRDAVLVYVDGHNNPGFSGGPIVFRHAETRAFRVAAVISGYHNEALPVLKSKDLLNPQATPYEDLYTRGNSGIVVGYDIEHIVKAIQATKGQ